MKIENHIINLPKPDEISVEYIESEIKKIGKPLRWSIINADDCLSVHAVVIA